MLATPGPLPEGDGWSFELKYDGIRAIVRISGQAGPSITSRMGNDITATFPELDGITAALDGNTAVLDGEIIAIGDDGLPSFHRLQERLGVSGNEARMRASVNPVVFVVFDVLEVNGLSTVDLPLSARRAVLDRLVGLHEGPNWRRAPVYDDGHALQALTRSGGLEGVVAKRNDAKYAAGRRSPNWVKVGNRNTDEFVIGGWVPGGGRREHGIGSILLGIRETDDAEGPLRWIGRVGTGFTDAELDRLQRLLADDIVTMSPFSNDPVEPTAVFVRPKHRCLVEYREWSPAGLLRFPSWRGLVQ
jgi:bifunctional non-homologous end joining protein LigD